MHIFVWLSIASWFVVIPVTSTAAFYGTFFQFGGVANQVLSTAVFWFYLPLSAIIALLPTIVFRFVKLYRQPTFVDLVRLKQKSEGGKSAVFQRLKFKRKVEKKMEVKEKPRTGYAYSHQQGFAPLITTGLIFGMNTEEVEREQLSRRQSVIGTLRGRENEDTNSQVAVQTNTTVSVEVVVEVQLPVTVDDADSGDRRKDEVAFVKEDKDAAGASDETEIVEQGATGSEN